MGSAKQDQGSTKKSKAHPGVAVPVWQPLHQQDGAGFRLIDANSSKLKATDLDKHRLSGMKQQGYLQDTLPLSCRMRHAVHRWLAPIQPHLQHLAAAGSAGTFLESSLKHITVTLATCDAVWEVYLDPKWAWQRLWLYGAQDRAPEQFFKKVRVDGWED
ncbi:hypothetical protein HaLaN_00840 [Haematococcus lacustris]|uniref:Uncharacterized protein n=1 Tax=Haematococcus lacustris TaxID=44745 RepID=A0A699YA84_HAELA|nr:hypothetical protein HaLaN_00840 [Haematococcus lacustris]